MSTADRALDEKGTTMGILDNLKGKAKEFGVRTKGGLGAAKDRAGNLFDDAKDRSGGIIDDAKSRFNDDKVSPDVTSAGTGSAEAAAAG